jgi:hypothetical protein
MADASQTRGLIPTVIHTDSENAREIAGRILAWTESSGIDPLPEAPSRWSGCVHADNLRS